MDSNKISPIVTIIMPAHVESKYLYDAIDSIVSQTFRDFTLLIIVNGKCTSLKDSILEKYNDPRIAVIYTPIPGLPFALNLGIHNSKSEILVRMDSDDICERNRLELIVDFMSRNKCVTVLGTAFYAIDENGRRIKKSTWGEMMSSKVRMLLPFRCVLPHPTVAFRRCEIIAAGGYSFGAFSEDYDLWLRLRRNKKIVFHILDEPLLNYRLHVGQATNPKNDYKILGYDLSLKIRELIISNNPIFLLGATFTLLYYCYRKLRNACGFFR